MSMGLLRLLRGNKASAPVARERLQILLAHERGQRGQPDLLSVLREEILAVVSKHVKLDPKFIMAQNGLGICLHGAACAALKSAANPSTENSPLGEPDRIGPRRQAMDWLKANLDLTAAMRGRGLKPLWSLSTWQVDPALAAVREPAELAKLPQAERAQRQRFWADVTAQVAADPVGGGAGRSDP